MASGGATRRVGGVAAAPVAPPGAARALLAPDQRFAGLAVRPPAGAGASDGDDGDDAVWRRHGVVPSGRQPELDEGREEGRWKGTWCWRMMARGAHSLGCAWPDRAASHRHR